MSKNFEWRLAQHVSSGKITQKSAAAAERFAVTAPGRLALRLAEQSKINELGGVGRDKLANKINSIAEKYWGRCGMKAPRG